MELLPQGANRRGGHNEIANCIKKHQQDSARAETIGVEVDLRARNSRPERQLSAEQGTPDLRDAASEAHRPATACPEPAGGQAVRSCSYRAMIPGQP